MSDVALVESGPGSHLFEPAVRLVERVAAEAVRGPAHPWSASETALTWSTRERCHELRVAVAPGGEPAGVLFLEFHREDNQHLVEVDLVVDPAWRRRGVGRRLWDLVPPLAAASGADTAIGFLGRPVTAEQGWELAAAAAADPGLTRSLDAGDDGAAAFARGLGAEQAQTEFLSRLDLPEGGVDPLLAPLEAEAARHAGGYEVTTWRGLPPPELRAGLALLRGRMTTDAPNGGLDIRPDEFSADRLEDDEAAHEAAGTATVWTLAVAGDGEVAAMNELSFRAEHPAWAGQGDTIVDAGHRGRRLGIAVKAAGLRRLVAEHPGVAHVTTWNAAENAPMLRVNRLMGFEPVGVGSAWQVKLA